MYLKPVRLILKTKTLQQSLVTVGATLLNGALGAAFYISLARFLGPEDFGVVVIAISLMTVIGDIADFGINSSLVRFVPADLRDNPKNAYKLLKISLEIKLVVWLLIFGLGYFLAPMLAAYFGRGELVLPLRLVLFGVGGAILFSFSAAAIQSFQRYWIWSALFVTTNFLRLILIIILILFGSLSITTGLMSFILFPFIGFILASFFLPVRAVLKAKNDRQVFSNLFQYSRFVALSAIIYALYSRVDIFLNGHFTSVFQTGIYGAASQLVNFVPQLIGALGVVAAPKFASFTSHQQMMEYLKKFQLLVLFLVIVGLLSLPLLVYLIPLIFGSIYAQSVVVFGILLMSTLVLLLAIPYHDAIRYYFKNSRIFVWINFFQLLLMIILGSILVTSFGIVGTAFAVLLSTIFNFVFSLLYFLYLLKKVK